MNVNRLGIVAATAAVLTVAPAATALAAPPTSGGCQDFGKGNVAVLATTLGPVFGATASGVASSAPQAFPTVVVHPEQTALCGMSVGTPAS